MRNHPVIYLFLLLLSLFFYIILGLSGDIRSEIEKYWLLIIPIYLVYSLIIINTLKNRIPDNINFLWFILFGVFFRIALMPADPFLSDDIYRYLWDGKVFAAGINPYKYAPVDLSLEIYRDQVVFPYINFSEIATSYPPVSQFIFLVNNFLGGTILSWKILLLFIEFGLFLVLFYLTDHFRLNKFRLLIYFYNPLLIIESYSSGHMEIAGVFFFWLAVYLFYKKGIWKSILFFALSIMTKFFPLISSIPFLLKKFSRKVTLLFTLCIALILPFIFDDTLPLPGLFSYINRWEFNGAIFQICVSVLNLFDVREYQWLAANFSGHLETFYINYSFYYKVSAVVLFAGVIFDQLKKIRSTSDYNSINYIQKSFMLTATFLLITPTLHPWYLIWIIPFLIFIPNWSWLLFTLLIQASYFVLKEYAISLVWQESVWVLLFQYIPFYIILLWEYMDTRKIKGWIVS